MQAWRIVVDGAGEAAWNMAMDEALFGSVCAHQAPPTLRLYSWRGPAVSLGRFQSAARTMRVEACQERGIPLVRRITGGRGILHGDDLTMSVAAQVGALGFEPGSEPSVIALYTRLADACIRVFARSGIHAVMETCAPVRTREPSGDCFQTISRADVIEASTGRKLLGAALRRRGDCVLQQASIPLHTPSLQHEHEEIAHAVFCGSDVLNAASDNRPPLERSALIAALISAWSGEIARSVQVVTEVSNSERNEAEKLCRVRYCTTDWTLNPRGRPSD